MRRMNVTGPLLAAALVLVAAPAAANGPVKRVSINDRHLAALPPADQERALAIRDRLEAIMAMDRQDMDRAERRSIRAEVRSLKAEAGELNKRAGGTVLYISTAGIIIILLLLIILL